MSICSRDMATNVYNLLMTLNFELPTPKLNYLDDRNSQQKSEPFVQIRVARLLTNIQTNAGKNITFLAKVNIKNLSVVVVLFFLYKI